MPGSERTRVERDSMGEMAVPAEAYYGASTQRAVLNFPISDLRMSRLFLRALGLLKRAAAEVNAELGLLDPKVAAAVAEAAQEVADGRWDAHFPVDVFQTGSGTSTNMNANEVIANLAADKLGAGIGSRAVHPNDQVNAGQSSNDVIPTVMHLAALLAIKDDLRPGLERLQRALEQKAQEFMPVIKTGRTHLQDATPIRLGQEFQGYAGQIERGLRRLAAAEDDLREVALGGTAVGTGINVHPEFARRVTARLSELTGVEIRETTNHFQAQNTVDAVVWASGALRTIAVSLLKIANDIRWMASGPRAGLFELLLPEVQPGSSIMPGKVNPVIPESVAQVAMQVIGNDVTITVAGQSGNFEINVTFPLVAHNVLQSINLLGRASDNFAAQCIEGLQATDRGPALVEQGLAICTALAPAIGYDAAAAIAKEAFKSGRTIREVALERTDLKPADLDRILDPTSMTEPGFSSGVAGG
ncbi:MAG TPA: class II fumarate hydratase [Chloroflexota bacterium]|nr:class II fumarate hydratase [Chloroflexota bacterium]